LGHSPDKHFENNKTPFNETSKDPILGTISKYGFSILSLGIS
jgi:hypothetical protein